jgi:predicted HNH restriction endonuclease
MELKIKELKKKIEEQENENVRLFKIFEYKMHKEEMQPIIQEWREGSVKLKALLNELHQLEIKERNERVANEENVKETKTFINGYGEATNKYITSTTYERAEKRRQKEVLSFMGNR